MINEHTLLSQLDSVYYDKELSDKIAILRSRDKQLERRLDTCGSKYNIIYSRADRKLRHYQDAKS